MADTSSYYRTFANVFGNVHPVNAVAAGLSSGAVQRAADRGTPYIGHEYETSISSSRAHPQPTLPLLKEVSTNLTSNDISGSHPGSRPIYATSAAPSSIFRTNRFTSPLEPYYALPNASACNSSRSSGASTARDAEYFPSCSYTTSTGSVSSVPMVNSARVSRSLDVTDIVGARARSRQGMSNAHTSSRSMDVSDIVVSLEAALNT